MTGSEGEEANAGPPGCLLNEPIQCLAKQWTTHILWVLGRQEKIRFGMLRRALPGDVSARVLAARLKELVALGLVHRKDQQTLPLNVEYSLTQTGKALDIVLVKSEERAAEFFQLAKLKSQNGSS